LIVPEVRTPVSSYRPLVILASTIVIVAALYFAQKILVPLALALLLAFVLGPAVKGLQRYGLGRVPSVIVTVVFAFLVLGAIGLAITYQLRGLARELPSRQKQIADKISNLLEAGHGTLLDQVNGTINTIWKDVTTRRQLEAEEASNAPIPVQIESPGYSRILQALAPVAEGLATAGLVVVLLIFMLIRREDLRNRLVRLIGHGRLVVTTRAMDEAGNRISRYLLTSLLINSAIGVTLGIGLVLIGVPYALVWGFLVGVLRFVPYVGTWLAASLLLGFSVAFFDGWTQPLLVFGLFVVVEALTFSVLEPLLFGHNTGISSVALLVAAAFWTWLWGPIGLILATPITACLVVLGKYVPQLEFFSILLGDEEVLDAEVTYYQRLLAHDQDEATDLVEAHLQNGSADTVYDEVLLPALVLAKQDRERGELAPEDEEFILQATRDVLDDLISPQQQIHRIATAGVPDQKKDQEPRLLLFSCAARDAEDELAARMFQQLMEASGFQVELLSAQTLSGELVSRVEQERPALICIAALPPGGLALTRYFCKRLGLHFPDLKIVVGRWGLTENIERTRERLLSAGAAGVAATLLESRNQVVPLVQYLPHLRTPEDQDVEPAAAR
jgi:predicted PurR-regulated permease PerM